MTNNIVHLIRLAHAMQDRINTDYGNNDYASEDLFHEVDNIQSLSKIILYVHG